MLGLSGLAIAQPLLDLFGRNPEFFVAGSYDRAEIVTFALAITLVPPAVGVGLVALAMAVSRRVGSVVFAFVVTLLSALFVLAVFRNADVDRAALALGGAVVFAAGMAFLVLRTRGGRLLAMYLSAANLVFVGMFFFASPTSALVSDPTPDPDLGRVDVPRPPGPVVLVVLDELPVSVLLRADGSLNGARYPNLVRLAATSTWFRNASSPHNNTPRAVPAILSGNVTLREQLPTSRDVPRNLMSLLGAAVPVHRYEIVTDMCPRSACAPPPQQPLGQALEDAAVVYGHRVLPGELRESLPRIDRSWGQYGSDEPAADEVVAALDEEVSSWSGDAPIDRAYAKWRKLDRTERSAVTQAAVLQERIAAVEPTPALHVVHVALPHGPWVLDRHGHRATHVPDPLEDPADPAFGFSIRQQYQLLSMQVGVADRLVGDLLDHLEGIGALEDALVVVTSDHGLSLSPPDFGRNLTEQNREEMLRVPLFIKAPGQVEGSVRDDPAQTIDILPSIIDLLGISTDWSFDGHSLFDASASHTAPRVGPDVEPLVELAAAHAAGFAGDDWVGLAGVGEHGALVGRSVADFEVGAPSRYDVSFQGVELEDLLVDDDSLPLVLPGWVRAPDGDNERPPELLVAVNGRLAGVIGGYRSDGWKWAFDAYVEDFYRRGDNEVAVYDVSEDAAGEVVLHPVG